VFTGVPCSVHTIPYSLLLNIARVHGWSKMPSIPMSTARVCISAALTSAGKILPLFTAVNTARVHQLVRPVYTGRAHGC